MGVFWIAKDEKFLHADNEGSDQTARMRSLIRVFVCAQVRKYVVGRCVSIDYQCWVRFVDMVLPEPC